MEDINICISTNLKKIRKAEGFTLEGLSERSGVSKSMLGEIERGSANPSILILWKIAEGLRIPLSRLIEAEKVNDFYLVRAGESTLINKDHRFSIYNLFPYYDPHSMEVHRVEIAPHSSLSNSGHRSGVDEYIFITEGSLGVTIGESELGLNTGDGLRFDGSAAHEFNNECREKACFINVLIYKDRK